ncbi:hypothetical protein LXA43DRAFT_1026435 [Ganoderma leucocontextum]|nr:hypothetical protein LXA43DRAFT_1026435 [Ganoderma leucocontextum]
MQTPLEHPVAFDFNEPNDHPHVPAPPPLNCVRQEIQQRLDGIEVKERELIRERLELMSRWNRSLAATLLPNEILLLIFVYFSELPQPPRGGYVDDDDNDELNFGLAKTGWSKLMLVCRRWCDVARETPALWRTIDVGKNTAWMKLALTRSGGATIDVSFPSYFEEEHASLLRPHSLRLRSLRLRSWSPYALRIIRKPLPALETLEIYNNPGGEDAPKGFYTDLSISRERFPNLRALQLAHTLVPRDPLFYARLRKLSLKACPFKSSLEQFVQLLSNSLYLEHLELDDFLQNLSNSENLHVGPARPLPSLLSLRLDNHTPLHSARFLSRVVIPQTASLSITAEMGAEEERADTLRAIVPGPPNLASSLPGLTTVTWVRLLATSEEWAIGCHPTQPGMDEPALIELALMWSDIEPIGWGHPSRMQDGMADLLALLGSAPLTHLDIMGHCPTVDTETWARLFRTFPSLVSLTADAARALFAGLHEASLSLANPVTGGTQPAIACRGLKRISINDHLGKLGKLEPLMDSLIRCLRYRADRGTRLEELEVDFHQITDATRMYLPQLKDIVSKVVMEYYMYSGDGSDDD